jgi:hypothetical protein
VEQNYLIVQPVELGGVGRPRLRLKNVYAGYTGNLARWFAITAPTTLLGSIVIWLADQKIHALYKSFLITEIRYHWAEVAESLALRYGSFLISWFLGCFALAAIATIVNNLDKGDREGVWVSDSFQRARERLGRLALVASLTFTMFAGGMVAIELIVVSIGRAFGWGHSYRFNYASVLVGLFVISSIVSWFGMAIPLILAEDIGAWRALRKSLKMSNGYEGFLLLLVCESLVGSYAAWYAVNLGLRLLFPLHLRYTEWYGWLVYLLTVLASAAVQPPMFIGFSLLASDGDFDASFFPRPQQPPHID